MVTVTVPCRGFPRIGQQAEKERERRETRAFEREFRL